MSANIIDQRTANLGLPLPNVNNMQDQDCGRIAESLRMLDAAHGKVRTDLAAVRVEVGEDLAAVTEQSANAARDADTAIGKANDAASVAQSAATAAASALEAAQNAKGAGLYVDVPIDQVPADVLAGMAVGQFITAPEPVASGGSAGDADLSAYPTREEVDKRLAQQATLYIGGTGASDTIIDGRGIYAGFPFETITAALAWGKTQYPAAHLIFELLGDVDEGDKDIVVSHANPVAIGSNNTERPTLRCGRLMFVRTFGKCNNFCISNNTSIVQPALEVRLGFLDIYDMRIIAEGNAYGLQSWLAKLYASNLSIDCNAASYAIVASYNSALRLYGDIKVNGELSGAVLYASAQSDIYGASITGAVTGKKYTVIRQSKIYIEAGIATIPGTIAGTCDESSAVA